MNLILRSPAEICLSPEQKNIVLPVTEDIMLYNE